MENRNIIAVRGFNYYQTKSWLSIPKSILLQREARKGDLVSYDRLRYEYEVIKFWASATLWQAYAAIGLWHFPF